MELSKPNFSGVKLNRLTSSFSDDFDSFIDDLLNFPTDANFVEETTIPETQLSLPVNDVDDLEWVSQFVDDDSFSGEYSLTLRSLKFSETVTLVAVNPSFRNPVHKRPRSKRSRTGGRVWSLQSTSLVTDSSASSCSTSSYSSKSLLCTTVNMQKRKRPEVIGSDQPKLRRCSHCLVQKTPQWRAGPLGAKTLCNACGVRFKSGRLLPEYRPACSPTFSGEIHSNNHQKVLEMRLKKAEAAGLV